MLSPNTLFHDKDRKSPTCMNEFHSESMFFKSNFKSKQASLGTKLTQSPI